MTLNIGRDLTGQYFLPHGKALRLLAAVGVVCNLSVSCPLVTLPLRDAVLRLLCSDPNNNSVAALGSDGVGVVVVIVRGNDNEQRNTSGSGNGHFVSDQSSSNGSKSNKGVDHISNSRPWLQALAAFGVTTTASGLAICLQHHFAAACSLVGAVASFTDSIILPLVFYHRLHPVCTYRLWILHAVMLLISFVTFGGGLVGNFCWQFPSVC